MENLAVKDSSEKDLFFKRLPQSLPGLPLPVAQYKLLPLLSQALEFGGAPAAALGSILQVQMFAPNTLLFLCGHVHGVAGCCVSASAATHCVRPRAWALKAALLPVRIIDVHPLAAC